MSRRRRVVVTGIGMLTPLGNNTASSWHALINGGVGITALPINHDIVRNQIPCTIAGQVSLSSTLQAQVDASPHTSMFTHYASIAAREAILDAGIPQHTHTDDDDDNPSLRSRIGVAIGSGIGDMSSLYNASITLHERGYRRISPFLVPKVLINMAAAQVCREHRFLGPCHAVSTACATGAHAIGDASRFIMADDADIMLAGGTESCIDVVSMAGFARMRALATSFNDDPTRASRPFDRDRQGFVMGEGAGVLVLEEYEHARARGARIYAELGGYGASNDAYHVTQPDPRGIGALASMRAALRHAQLRPEQVQYVNAHATSTPVGDEIEERAINELFPPGIMVSSTKGATGHLLGAAGAIEAAFTVLSLYHGVIPPTCNLDNICTDSAGHIHHIAKQAIPAPHLRAAVCNSFGFGSTNASLAFQAYSQPY